MNETYFFVLSFQAHYLVTSNVTVQTTRFNNYRHVR